MGDEEPAADCCEGATAIMYDRSRITTQRHHVNMYSKRKVTHDTNTNFYPGIKLHSTTIF